MKLYSLDKLQQNFALMKEASDTIKERVKRMKSWNDGIPSILMEEYGVSGVCIGLLVIGCLCEGYSKSALILIGGSMVGLSVMRGIFFSKKSKSRGVNVIGSVVLGVLSLVVLVGFMYAGGANHVKDSRGLFVEMGIMSLICNGILRGVVGWSFGRIVGTVILVAAVGATLFISLDKIDYYEYKKMMKKIVGGQIWYQADDQSEGKYVNIKREEGYEELVDTIITRFVTPVVNTFSRGVMTIPIYRVDVPKGPRSSTCRFDPFGGI